MKSESILILGAGLMQIPAIKSAKALGYRVFAADANAEAPGIKLADGFCHIDLKDHRAIADEAVRLRKEENLAAAFTAGTDFSASVAYAVTAAGLPGLDYTTAMTASNKILMRRAFSEAGVPSPSFYPVKNTEEAVEACMNLDFPVVIKPVDSMGARGVIRIDSLDDMASIESAVGTAIASSRSSEAIVEEFIDGREYSLDALIYDGKITVCGFADRHIFFPPYFIEMGHTMPTDSPAAVQDLVVDVFIRGIKAIGINEGAAKGDIKYSPSKGAMVGEIAARLSGGFMSGWTFPYHSGVDLTSAAIMIAAGKPPGRLEYSGGTVSAERAALSIPGRVAAVYGIEDAGAVEFVRDVFVHTRQGEDVDFPVNNVQKCANCISAAPDRDLASAAAEDAVRKIFIRLEASNSRTADFIGRRSCPWVPDAYVLTRRKDMEFLSGLSKNGKGGMLPEIAHEAAVDWHGQGMREAIDRFSGYTHFPERRMTFEFWNAFLRGGLQGAVWFADTFPEGEIRT